jgi:hypothetical protein
MAPSSAVSKTVRDERRRLTNGDPVSENRLQQSDSIPVDERDSGQVELGGPVTRRQSGAKYFYPRARKAALENEHVCT